MPHQMSKDVIPVRKGEEINLQNLDAFLHDKFQGLPSDPVEIHQFSAGHSNLTYEIQKGDWKAVLRRPPLGHVAPKAHDMEREFKVISEIQPFFPVAPKPLLYSNDLTLIGSPFFIMERKNGVVLDTTFPDGIVATRELGDRISKEMVHKLVDLHAIDYKQTGLVELSKPVGFMERQVHGWISRYQRAKTDEVAEEECLKKWLVDHIPSNEEATIIHYDYKLNNAMFDEKLTEMIGLFDWEMTTVGDPLVDVGAAMSYWIEEEDPDLLKRGFGKPSITLQDGFMTRREFIEEYARLSGRDVSNINFYLTFAYFKLAVICQQIYYRFKKGQTNDLRFSHFNQTVNSLIKHGMSVANKSEL